MGLMFGLIYAAYGLAFWYGCKLVMDYRKKEEFMECILKCVADEGDFECFLNCDRFVINIICRVPIFCCFQVHCWLCHDSDLRDFKWWDANWTVQHVR